MDASLTFLVLSMELQLKQVILHADTEFAYQVDVGVEVDCTNMLSLANQS